MILGEYKHSIDGKSRMFLPAKLREELGDVVYLVKGIDPCISVYPLKSWTAFMEKLDSLPQIEAREIRRFIYSSVVETPIDSQGRILVPQQLRDYAHLEKNVKVIGAGDYAEIWDDAVFSAKIDSLDNEAMISKLVELGF